MQGSKTIRILSRISWVVLLLTAFVFGIKQLREPDIFWQLRTGEWIVQHHTVMDKDIFSYTFHNAPWINVKWGSEVLQYFMYCIGGVEFTPVLQCIASLLIMFIFFALYRRMRSRLTGSGPGYPDAAFLVTAILFLVATAYRMNGRPEMTSHVLTGLFLLLLLRYRDKPTNFIFILVPLEMFWANMHEAYGTGEVIMGVMLLAAWFEHVRSNEKKIINPLRLSATVILAIAATAVHPYGLKMILHPYEIFSQVSENKFTTELLSVAHREYWQKEAWLNLFFLITTLGGLFLPYTATKTDKKALKWFLRPYQSFGLGYIVLLILFFYLSLTAYRNIIFFIIVSAPATACCLAYLFSYGKAKIKVFASSGLRTGFYGLILALSVFFYISIPTNLFYNKAEHQNNHYGLRLDPVMSPIGAVEFIRANHVDGRCFSDFLISNYLLWELRPDFKTFIDLRDLDVFPSSFFKDFALITDFPQKFKGIDERYHFDYAVLYRGNFDQMHKYLSHSKEWAPVYADPVAAIYLKHDTDNNRIVARAQSQHPDGDLFSAPARLKPSAIASMVSNIFWPGAALDFARNDDFDLIAANYYSETGDMALAVKRAKASIAKNTPEAFDVMGDILLDKYNSDSAAQQKQADIDDAESNYGQALDKNKKDAKALLGLARVQYMKNDPEGAMGFVKKSIACDPNIKNAYVLLANTISAMQPDTKEKQAEYARAKIDALEHALALDETDTYLKFYLGLSYGNNGDCDKAVEYLKKTMNYPGIPKQELEAAKKIMLQCGGNDQ